MRPSSRTGSFQRIAPLCALVAGACTAANPAYRIERGQSPDAGEDETVVDALPRLRPDATVAVDLADPAPDAAIPADSEAAPDLAPPDLRADGLSFNVTDAAPDTLPAITIGLVSRWRLDGSSGTMVTDDTGRNPGTLQNTAAWNAMFCPRAPFPNSAAVAFDGARAAIRLGTALPALDDSKTLSLWFWVAATPTADRKDLITLQNTGRMQAVQVGIERGRLAVWGWNIALGTGAITTTVPVPAGWNHAAYTYDDASVTQRLYLNGTMVGMSRAAPPDGTVSEALLGAYSVGGGGTEYFNGRMDDVRIYDRALTGVQIGQLADGAP